MLPDPWRIVAVVVAAVIEVGQLYLWIRFLRRYKVTTGVEAMIGERAEVIGPGRVRVRGEIWKAPGSDGCGVDRPDRGSGRAHPRGRTRHGPVTGLQRGDGGAE